LETKSTNKGFEIMKITNVEIKLMLLCVLFIPSFKTREGL